MPNVSDEFVKHAERLAQGTKTVVEKAAAVQVPNASLKPLAEAAVDALIGQGMVPAQHKEAAVKSLLVHEEALKALHKTAVVKTGKTTVASAAAEVEKMGDAVTDDAAPAVDHRGETLRESDKQLFRHLGFNM